MSEEHKETSKESAKSPKGKSEKAAPPAQSADPATPAGGVAPEQAAKAPADKPAAAKPAPAAAAAKAEEPPPPPEPGECGKRLQAAKLAFTPLGMDSNGLEALEVIRDDLLRVGEFLRDECGLDLMLSCSGIDWKTHRESVYHLYNTKTHTYLTLKVKADENDHSPSLTPVWPAADWHERESYDLVGIHYDGHPNLTRILMPVDWLGHPLRKDYKVDDPRLVWNER